MKKLLLIVVLIISSNNFFAQDGMLDTSYKPTSTFYPNFSAIQPDGKILFGASSKIIRVNTDGSIDNSFNIGTGASYVINTIVTQKDGKILAAGSFSSFNGTAKKDIVRLNNDGSVDLTFDSGTGVNSGSQILTMSLQSDGKILIGGSFINYNNISKNSIARLNQDGSFDSSFAGIGTDTQRGVDAIVIQPDNKIIIGGSFNFYNNAAIPYLTRINSDGSIDNSFGGIGGYVQFLTIQPNGKVLVSNFNSSNSTSNLNRLNPNGESDSTFNIGTGANGSIYSILLQNDGKIIICGGFTTFNNISRNRIARLNIDGSLDTTFNPGTGTNGVIYTSKIQQDSKVVIAGGFSNYNGTSRGGIARLNNTVLSVSENFREDLMIYPNPVKNILKIETKSKINNAEIFSISGQKVKEFSSKEVNVSEFPKGIYILKLTLNNEIVTQKFIKE